MELKLKNKIALVTGSSKGIGKEIANSLLEEGCKVILNGKNKISLKKTSGSFGTSITGTKRFNIIPTEAETPSKDRSKYLKWKCHHMIGTNKKYCDKCKVKW